jgi:hypothetical protein
MFFSSLRRLFGRNPFFGRPALHSPIRKAASRPNLEALEDRALPAFLAPTTAILGNNTAGIAVADFNHDGKDDMAVANQSAAGTVSILLSNGNGSFQPAIAFAAGSYASDAAAGDFNGDGNIDLAVAGLQGTVNVLFGAGDGTFSAPTLYSAGSGAHSIKAGDFNHDGKLDLATMNSTSASLLLGNGDGTFQAPLSNYIPGNSTNMIVGDFDRDGNLDLVTSNTMSTGTITLLHGRGDGSFDAAQSYYAYSAPVYVASGDFNNDGYDDLAVANSYAATSMSVIMNHGDGTFEAPKTYSIAQTGYEIEAGDFNHDGNEDFAVRGSSQYMVSLGKGDGTFYSSVNYSTPAGRFESGSVGDFDGDGATDFAYASTGGVTVMMNANDDVANVAGATTFQVSTPASSTSGSAVPMTVTAVDAQGNVVTGFRGTVYVTSNDAASNSAISYTFTAADAGVHAFGGSVRLSTLGSQTITVAAPFMTQVVNTVTVTPAVSRLGVSSVASSVAGDTILVTVTAYDSLGSVGTGYGGTIRIASSDTLAGLPQAYTFTADDAGVHTFAVTLKSAGARFVGVSEVGGTLAGGTTVNVSAAAASSFTLTAASGAIGVARSVTLSARDIYGNFAAFDGVAALASSDAAALIPSSVVVANGSASFSVTFFTVGTQTITATDLASGSITGTISSDATPPIAKLFTVAGYPNTVAGVSHNFTVTVRDTIGQIATGFTGTVYFSSSDVQAGLPASYTFTAADAGAHTFSAALRTAGLQSITVRDLSGVLYGSEMGIAVTPAAFAKFNLSVPNGKDSRGHVLVTAGDNISLTVVATDAFGNQVSGYRGKVKFTSTDTQAGLPTDYTFTAADNGSHTFNVVLKTVTPNGTVWSFNVVDASNASSLATITNFEVNNAAASKIVLNVPSNITAGTPFALKISVFDAFGNKVKNYFGTVRITSSVATPGLPLDYTFTTDDAGAASVNVTLTTVAKQTLTVTDTSISGLIATVTADVRAGTTTTTGGGGTGGGGSSGGGKKV